MSRIEIEDRAVFTGNELKEIYNRCAPDAVAWATMYGGISEEHKKSLDLYLRDWFSKDPNEFIRRFVDRNEVDKIAQELAPQYLKKYSQLTGMVELKNHFGYGPLDENQMAITMVNKPLFKWLSPRYDKYFVLNIDSIRKLKGHLTEFTIRTNGAVLRFSETNIGIDLL